MAKRMERRAPRGVDYSGRQREEADQPAWRRWWNGATKTIVGAGALASAVAAIVSLWPAPDPANAAAFHAVRITPEVPFSEYRQRIATAHGTGEDTFGMGGLHLAAAATAATGEPAPEWPPEPAPEPSDTAPPADATSVPPTTSAPESSPVEPAAPLLQGSAVEVEPSADKGQTLRVDPRRICDHMKTFASACRANPGLAAQYADSTLPSASPTHGVEQEERGAAGVDNIFQQARKVPADESEPLGVVVTVELELTGMRDRPAHLSWSMWQQGGARRLHGEWLNTNLAYRLVATSDRDTASLDFWIPLPPEHGAYFIRSVLAVDGATVASADSETFK
ncbi:hypothetical protein ACTMTJ_35300 [Phytohabitans sp. LJ34]|uniref:hypothetical protein n=1 Tax=Phytohabitans sp. LJ34 TaxID=3452217 RepID=UPI003F89547F